MVPPPNGDGCVIWLDGAPLDRALVGGKGASLGRLARLGAPVPPAFALTTRAYVSLAHELGLPRRIGDASAGDLATIRATIEAAPLPPVVREPLLAGFDALRDASTRTAAVAVRSSATAEDGAARSFAGLHDTILDVRDPPALEAAVKRCWASLWTERAVAYRRAAELAKDEATIAVVVQHLIRCDVSMVVFTADPVSGRDDRLVIDAAWGLGEAVVSGLVTPDHVVVGPNGQILDYAVGEKELMVIPGQRPGDGVRQVPVPRAMRGVPVLSPEQVAVIAATARDLARRLGYPADLEGGLAAGRLYIFQARPITTLGTTGRIATRSGAVA